MDSHLSEYHAQGGVVTLRVFRGALCVALLFLVSAWIASLLVFGGIRPGLAWARGEVVYVDPPLIEREVESGSVVAFAFQVRKLTRNPVSIVGAVPGCNCVTVDGLPLELDSTPQQIEVVFTAGRTRNTEVEVVEQHIPLVLSVDAVSALLSVRALVRHAPEVK